MAFDITEKARQAAEQLTKQFNIVLEIDGLSTLFGVQNIKKFVRIGDPGLLIGGGWDIGGLNSVDDQGSYISYSAGTSTELSQVLQQDKGQGETVTRYQIAVIDKNKTISNLLAPGNLITDIIGRRCTVWGGFAGTAWLDDYIVIHRGIIDDYKSGFGTVTFNISAPDVFKKGEIFRKAEAALNGNLSAGATVANVDDTSEFLQKATGPDGIISTSFLTYIRIEDEIIEFETKTATQFQTMTRGALGTTAVSHSDGTTVNSFYRIPSIDPMTCALRVLLGGRQGPYLSGLAIKNFVRTEGTDTVTNSIFFEDTDIVRLYNIHVGDYVSTSGATNGANNFTNKKITGIVKINTGTYITVDSVSLVEELATSALIDFRSQYDIWPVGAGLAMNANEVDIDEHLDIKFNFLSNNTYDFYLKDTWKGKDFLSQQVYNPVSCFSLPRKAQSSVGIHRPPLPGSDIKTLDTSNVLNAGQLKLQRTINKDFYNAIIVKFEENTTTKDFNRGIVTTNATSITRIPVGNQPLTIESKGLRTILSSDNVINEASTRRLNKYKFGAEKIRGVKTNTVTGWTIEVGDAVVIDMSSLQITDTATGTRAGKSRLFDCVNKKLNTKNGIVTLDLVDSAVDTSLRFGLISPSSFVNVGISTTQVTIKPSFNTDRFGVNEYRKWDNLNNAAVIIRSQDYSVQDTSTISQIFGNTFTFNTALSFVPLADYIIELDIYDNQPDNVKLLYAFMTDNANFADGGNPYVML